MPGLKRIHELDIKYLYEYSTRALYAFYFDKMQKKAIFGGNKNFCRFALNCLNSIV